MVSSLMCTDDNRWDVDILKDIFEPRDVNLILSIPLHNTEADSWYCKKEKLGFYTVKTAYRMIQENKAAPAFNGNSRFWNNLWILKVPPKVKHFIWRAFSNCLPTKEMLRTKHVEVNPLFPLCNMFPETVSQVLLECSFSQACWNRVESFPEIIAECSSVEWLLNAFNSWSNSKRQLWAMVCWAILKCRNDILWNQKGLEVINVVESAKLVLRQWQSAQDKHFDSLLGFMSHEDGDEHWSLPSENKSKVNTDAAIFFSSSCYSFAFVARNHAGELIEARSRCVQGRVSPESAEAIGIKEALSWIKERQLSNIAVESDCLVAVQAIRSSLVLLSYFGRLISECKELLSQLQNKGVSLRFVKRSANHVAHYLASYSSSIVDRIWWRSNAHPDFLRILENYLKH